VRTWLGVPLREGDSIVGVINLMRQEVRPCASKDDKAHLCGPIARASVLRSAT
jgi:hypothetical protein